MIYQKYRPSTFDEMVGNESEIACLKATIERANRPHVYLFVGHSGCGKTTAARICARQVGAGELSITEINSANNNGVATARDIIDQMRQLPLDGSAQVFIIDELHKTTNEWQNAMLKALEDTPDHVYFFLCTTDPQKLLPTLKNRCQMFNFKDIDKSSLLRLVRRVAKKEAITVSDDLIQTIVQNGEGSARKVLQLLEKVQGMEELAATKLIESYVEEDSVEVIELCRMLLSDKASWSNVAELLKKLKEKVNDAETIRHIVLGYMSSVLLSGKQNPKAAVALEFFSEAFYASGYPGVVLACYQTVFA